MHGNEQYTDKEHFTRHNVVESSATHALMFILSSSSNALQYDTARPGLLFEYGLLFASQT